MLVGRTIGGYREEQVRPRDRVLEGGEAVERSVPLVPPKLGSVVVAIPAAQVPAFAAAALDSTFYLALAPGAP